MARTIDLLRSTINGDTVKAQKDEPKGKKRYSQKSAGKKGGFVIWSSSRVHSHIVVHWSLMAQWSAAENVDYLGWYTPTRPNTHTHTHTQTHAHTHHIAHESTKKRITHCGAGNKTLGFLGRPLKRTRAKENLLHCWSIWNGVKVPSRFQRAAEKGIQYTYIKVRKWESITKKELLCTRACSISSNNRYILGQQWNTELP